MIVDRTGLVLSDASRATTRMRKIDDKTIEAQMTIEDRRRSTRAVDGHEALSQAAARHVGLGLLVRREQPQPDRRPAGR